MDNTSLPKICAMSCNGIKMADSQLPLAYSCKMQLQHSLELIHEIKQHLLSALHLADAASGKRIHWKDNAAQRRRPASSMHGSFAQPASVHTTTSDRKIWSQSSMCMVSRIGRSLSAGVLPPSWPSWSAMTVAAAEGARGPAAAATTAAAVTAAVIQIPKSVRDTTGLSSGSCLRLQCEDGPAHRTLALLTASHCVVSKAVKGGSTQQTTDLVTVCDVSVVFSVLRRHWGSLAAWPSVQCAWPLLMHRLAQMQEEAESKGAAATQPAPKHDVRPTSVSLWHPQRVRAASAAAQSVSEACSAALAGGGFAMAASRAWLLQV